MAALREPIAIIGSGCRFPGGSNSPSKLWELLRQPRDLLRKVPTNRYDSKAYYHPDPTHHGTTDVQESHFLDDDPALFDNSFFNIQPAESEAIDPQQRMLLETVYDSLCAAGLTIEGLRASSTAVYVGVMCDDWSGMLSRDWESTPTYAATGMGRSIMSNRISYFFDWRGPSMTIDTACSSSLVAVHQAIQTLLSGESRVAVAAGANLILSPAMYIAESKLRMLSPTGRSRMWDKAADGYARGEGIAAVVLKSLSAALEDGDHVECIIRATGVNQDGRTPGLTMPSGVAQAALIRDTYARAGLDINNPKDRPQFFHAHGTGTPAGDPQEAEGISRAFFGGETTADKGKLYVGSLKTIIGHTEGTAGLASLIGTSLAIQHGIVPPNMRFSQISPLVAPFYEHLEVPTTAKGWPSLAPGQVRRASVNSFGFGGTNAHAIIEAYEPKQRKIESIPVFTPFTISAASERSLRIMMADYSNFLKAHPQVNLRDLAWTLQTRRSTLSYRKAIAGRSQQDICEKIDSLLDEANAADANLNTRYFNSASPCILGVFTGQGAQWPRMGANLIEASPLVAERIARLDESLADLPIDDRPSWTLKDELLAGPSTSRLSEAVISQPLCTAVQIVLVDLLRLAGVKLHAVIGHSSGEIAAAYAAGLISARDAIRIAYYRGLHAQLAKSPNGVKGAMMAVGTSLEDASSFCELESFEGRIQVAACNSSSSITLSGDEDAIAEAVEIFKDEQKFARILKVDTAYHSTHMRTCAIPYLHSIGQCAMEIQDAHGPTWYSSVVSGLVMSKDTLKAQYWVDNMTNAVLFSSAVATAVKQSGPFDIALEIGPHPALKGPCLANLEEASGTRIPYSGFLSRDKNDVEELSSALGFIWTHLGSGSVDFDAFEKGVSGSAQSKEMVVGLPTYPFDHQRSFWAVSRIAGAHTNNHTAPHPLLGRRCIERDTSQEVQWLNILRPKEINWLKCHKLQGQIVFPATAYVAMAIEAMTILAGDAKIGLITVEDLTIGRAIAFNDENSSVESLFSVKLIESSHQELVAEFACYSSLAHETSMLLNASGRAVVSLHGASADALPFVQSQHYNMVEVEIDRFYASLTKLGYGYSSPFNCITQIKRKIDYATGIIEDHSGSAWEDELVVHPGLLDTALQTIFAAYCCPGDERLWSLHVPTHIQSIIVNPRYTMLGLGKQRVTPYQAVLREDRPLGTSADVHLFAEDAQHTFIQVEGVHLVPFSEASPESDAVLFSRFDYRIASPNGDLAAAGDGPTPMEIEMAIASERISYFYLRRLVESITPEEKEKTLPHYQGLLNWAAHVVGLVSRGEHLAVSPECQFDKHEQIVRMVDKHRERVDVRLLESVGENLPAAIRDRTNILEHMTKDGILDQFYEDGLGLDTANRWIARMVSQVAHRYPRMHILEIGAGTGGSTRAILPMLGSAFSSYTYTDISSAFFEPAQERFKDYASRMIFKSYDMERSPGSQGFVEGSYDLVLASNVLHATNKLEEMMINVRQLLKPGGYVIIFEITSNDLLRVGLPMGGLPGWWVGANSGRPWGPAMTLPQWDSLLRKCGFAGIETATPPFHELHPCSVYAAQAIDERVNLLRNPLSLLPTMPATESPQLTVVGGKSLQVHQLIEQISSPLKARFTNITRVASIEAFNAMELPVSSTVLCLTELDEPLLRTVTPAKLDALKVLWGQARNILWVTCGSRAEEPHSFMMVGMGRAMRAEYPNINLQMLDIDFMHDRTPQMLAQTLLRLELLDIWQRENSLANLMWSSEPEVVVENGLVLIPRLYPNKDANRRYNTSRRAITRAVNPQQSTILLADSGSSFELQDISPLRVPESPSSPDDRTLVRISYSLLQMINVESVGYMMLCAGTNLATNEPVIALSDSAESPAPVLSGWTIPVPQSESAKSLLSIAAHIAANHMIKMTPKNGTLLVHEPDPILSAALVSQAEQANIKVFFATSLKRDNVKGWLYVHRNLPQRLVKKTLPRLVSVYVDLSQASGSAEVGRLIAKCMPQHCITADATSFFGTRAELRPSYSIKQVIDALRSASLNSSALDFGIDTRHGNIVIPLQEISSHNVVGEPLTVLDWSAPSVPVAVTAIDEGKIFKSDKTYLLVGLSGEVGQSLCQWMVGHGARHVVLTSRRPKVNPDYIRSLEKMGATVKVLPLDITSRDSLHACYADISRTMPPIAGVANGAMVLQDAMFENMTFDSMIKVLRPKVEGTKLLDELFHDAPLDFFIMFSSLTAVVGNSGQSNYIAANMYMTAVACQRKKRGVAGSAIDISSLMGIGYVERSENFDADYFSKIGYTNISEQDLHQLFAEAIVVGRPDSPESAEIATGLSPIYADKDVKAQYRTDLKFVHFIMERPGTQGYASKTSAVPVRVRLSEAKNKDHVYAIIYECFIARLKRTLQIPEEETVNERVSLVEQGVDSLMAVEVRSWFLKELDIDMPVLKVLGGSSVTDLLNDAMERLSTSVIDMSALDGVAPAPTAKAPPPPTPSSTKRTSAETTSAETSSLGDSTDDDSLSTCETTLSTDVEEAAPSDPLKANQDEPKKASWRDIIIKSSTEVTQEMSFGQARFWFLNHYLKDKRSFNMAVMFRLTGPLRVNAMEDAVRAIAQRHEALRTRFFWSGNNQDTAMQGILSSPLVQLEKRRISSEAEAQEELKAMHDHVWDLQDWESMKIRLLSLSDTVHYIVVGCHHITLDGVSFSVLFVDLEAAYTGKPLSPLPAESQYRAFAAQQRRDYEAGRMNKAITFYRKLIPQDLKPIPPFSFAKVHTRKTLDCYNSHEAGARLEPALTTRIKQLARRCRATTFHVYLAALQALMFRLLPETNNLFIGIADANRMDRKYMGSLGFFLNLLPLRFDRSKPNAKFSEAVQAARNKAYGALEHSELPFDVLLNELNVSRSSSHTPIFQVFVDYRQVVQERARFGECETGGERWCNARTGYDVSLEITENPAGDSLLAFRLQEALYSESNTELLLRSYVTLLEEFSKGGDLHVESPPLWPRRDIEKALEVGKGPAMKLEWPPTVSHRIDDMIQKHASGIALKDGHNNVLTYDEMAARINAIASSLYEVGVSDGTVVAVFQEPTVDWICSMLAIYRVGAIYLPLDLRNCIARLSSTVRAACPSIILASSPTLSKIQTIGAGDAAAIDVSKLADVAVKPSEPNRAKPASPAVILFTSGSTGEPKGIVINHDNLRAQSEAYSRTWQIAAGATMVLQQSAFSFDFSLDQIFAALANGGCLYVVPAAKRGDPQEITKLMAEQRVTYTSATPSEYQMWFRYAANNLARCTSWKYAFAGGEPLGRGLIQDFRNLGLPGVRLFNNYGPAEITIASTKGEVQYNDPELEDTVPAGFMLPNYAAYIVDENLKPLPIGVPGEIVVGGAGVAAGYLGMDSLTKQKFLPDMFAEKDGNFISHGWRTMYRTGDRGRLREDGAIYCDGRIDGDTQVKLRGFRIELGEVENAILQAAGGALSNVVVSLRGDSDSRFLAAHVVFSTQYPNQDRATLLKTLQSTLPLPQYMCPSVIVPLVSIPLTTHLKIDRKVVEALPLPSAGEEVNTSRDLTQTEEQLRLLWQQVMSHGTKIEADSDFFHVGGHSLLLVKLQALVKQSFHVAPRLIDLMNASKLNEMASVIEAASPGGVINWNEETNLPYSLLKAKQELAPESSAGQRNRTDNLTVILTGATGYLGRHLLSRLIEEPRVSKVCCIVRSKDLEDGHAIRVATKSRKMSIYHGDLAQPNLGLSEVEFGDLSRAADVIVHCGANRSFWDSYEVLRAVNVGSVKELARLALPRHAPLHVLSSGAVQLYDSTTPPVNGSDGYVASKWAAEQFLRNAAQALDLPVRIHRPFAAAATGNDISLSDASAISILHELTSIAQRLGVRPAFDGLRGHVDVTPINAIVGDICATVFEDQSGAADVQTIQHDSQLRIDTRDFADEVDKDADLKALGTMRSLEWFGEAKRMGFSYFIASQELVMNSESGELVSRR